MMGFSNERKEITIMNKHYKMEFIICFISLVIIVPFIFYLIYNNYDNKEIGENSSQEQERKEIIKLYTTDLFDPILTNAVELFNERNENYQIEVTGCSGRRNEKGEWREPEEVLEIEIKKQGKPDILYWDSSYSNSLLLRKYIRKGMLADLYPFLKRDGELSDKIYDKKILKASMIDGKLYQLPDTFELKVLLGNKKMMGDKDSWTMKEMLSLYKELPESFMYMTDISKENYIGDVFCYQQLDYIDRDTGKFDVKTEDFKNILRFAKYLPDKEADISCSSKWTKEKMIPKGQLLLTRQTINNGNDIKQYEKIYKKAGGCNILSYPSINGSNGILMDVFMIPFVILEDSKYKEQAWEFLCLAESKEGKKKLEQMEKDGKITRTWYFSAKKKALKKGLKQYKKEKRKKIKALLRRVGRIRTEYDFKYPLRYSIYGDNKEKPEDGQIETEEIVRIIQDNAKEYFDGKETVEKAVKKIQKNLEKFYKEKR